MTVLGNDPKYSNKNYYNILREGYCEISATSSYSQRRWDAMYTIVNFYIPQDKFGENASNLTDIKEVLLKVSRSVMPPNAGYDVMEINISPNLNTTRNNILDGVIIATDQAKLDILSDEIKQKGKEMSELYVTIYCVENSLRNFIDTILSNALGENYFTVITVPSDIAKGISTRKKEEKQNKWLPLRGDKDIYYLDFIDLTKLIQNNWEFFKTYFPSQGWISTKIDEHERDIIVSLFRQLKEELASGANISEAAYDLGFNYPQHFSRMFKKFAGVSPSQYVNNLKNSAGTTEA